MDFLRFIIEMHRGMFSDGLIGILIGILLIVVELLIFAIIFIGIFYVIDSSFRPNKTGQGMVIEKNFTAAHTTTTLVYNAALKMSTPVTTYHDDEWELIISVDDKQDSVSVSEVFFNTQEEEDILWVEYKEGRFSSSIYIVSIENL